MNIGILTTQVPFTRGGAEVLAESLRDELKKRAFSAEIITLPFNWYPADKLIQSMLVSETLDFSEVNGKKIDRIITLKFPAYLVQHPAKSLWLLHQYRTAYDMWEGPYCDLIHQATGRSVREVIHSWDRKFLEAHDRKHTISRNVTNRLKKFSGVESGVLYPPPAGAQNFYNQTCGDYFLYPSRLDPIKRQHLVLQALALTPPGTKVVFAGEGAPAYTAELRKIEAELGIANRVVWKGYISETEKYELYANSKAIIFTPDDEDLGYISMEAALSRKPLISCSDSGGALEFAEETRNAWIAEPTPEALGAAISAAQNSSNKTLTTMGEESFQIYKFKDVSWDSVINGLVL